MGFSIINASASGASPLQIVNLTTPVAARFELNAEFEDGFGPKCFYYDYKSGNWTDEGASLVTSASEGGVFTDVECEFTKLSEEPEPEPDSWIPSHIQRLNRDRL